MNKILLSLCFLGSLNASQHIEINVDAHIRQEYNEQMNFFESVNKLIAFIQTNGFDITPVDYDIKDNLTLFCVAEKKEPVKLLSDIKYSIDLTIVDLHGNVIDSYDIYRDFGSYWESLNPYYKWGGFLKLEDK